MPTLRIDYADEAEMRAKLVAACESLGFVCVDRRPDYVTVGELAAMVGRKVNSVSRALRGKRCPQFIGERGKRRIVRLVPNERLLKFLNNGGK